MRCKKTNSPWQRGAARLPIAASCIFDKNYQEEARAVFPSVAPGKMKCVGDRWLLSQSLKLYNHGEGPY